MLAVGFALQLALAFWTPGWALFLPLEAVVAVLFVAAFVHQHRRHDAADRRDADEVRAIRQEWGLPDA